MKKTFYILCTMVLCGIVALMSVSTFCFYYCQDVFFTRDGMIDVTEFPGLLMAAWAIITFAGGYILGKYWWNHVYEQKNHWWFRFKALERKSK